MYMDGISATTYGVSAHMRVGCTTRYIRYQGTYVVLFLSPTTLVTEVIEMKMYKVTAIGAVPHFDKDTRGA